MKREICLLFTILVLILTASAQKATWLSQLEKIKPLESSEKQVEKVLGKAKDRYADVGEYKTKEGLFTVTYSEGRCKSTITPKYNVEKGTVVKFDFSPTKKFILSSLGIDLSDFIESKSSDVADANNYDNAEKGITYYFSNNYLNYVEVYPPEGLSYFECSQQAR